MYFLRVDFTYDHRGVTRTRDLVDDEFAVIHALRELASDSKVTILAVRVELCH